MLQIVMGTVGSITRSGGRRVAAFQRRWTVRTPVLTVELIKTCFQYDPNWLNAADKRSADQEATHLRQFNFSKVSWEL